MRIRTIAAVALIAGATLQPAPGRAELTESKRAKITELLTIVGVVGMAEQMREQQGYVELMRMQASYPQMMDYAVSQQADLSEENRQLLRARLEDFGAFAERFRSLFIERLNFSEIISSVYPPIYDKHFTDDELAEMLAFYRTPVGRKSIEVMPSLMEEAAIAIEQAVRPQAVALIQEIVADEAAKLSD